MESDLTDEDLPPAWEPPNRPRMVRRLRGACVVRGILAALACCLTPALALVPVLAACPGVRFGCCAAWPPLPPHWRKLAWSRRVNAARRAGGPPMCAALGGPGTTNSDVDGRAGVDGPHGALVHSARKIAWDLLGKSTKWIVSLTAAAVLLYRRDALAVSAIAGALCNAVLGKVRMWLRHPTPWLSQAGASDACAHNGAGAETHPAPRAAGWRATGRSGHAIFSRNVPFLPFGIFVRSHRRMDADVVTVAASCCEHWLTRLCCVERSLARVLRLAHYPAGSSRQRAWWL